MGQDRIVEQVAAMSTAQRQRLISEFPQQVGNTDGVPWAMRVAANRVNIAQAIVDTKDPGRIALYRSLLGEVDDPTGSGSASTVRSSPSIPNVRRWWNSTATFRPRRAWPCWSQD